MNVLVVGGGGREHALCWKLAQSPQIKRLFCAPGNPGTASMAENINIVATDVAGLRAFCKANAIEFVVVGPEAALTAGLGDALRAEDIAVFGPSRDGAELEGSKAFAKGLMSRGGIPTASYRVFHDARSARDYLRGGVSYPLVVKASGLAGGKGVVICEDETAATDAVSSMIESRLHGDSGSSVLIEEFLHGEEVSIHCLTDGSTMLTLPTSQDHKRLLDGDQGPNTGGMGAVSPATNLDAKGIRRVEEEILFPTLHQLSKAGRSYRGVIYAGLMLTRSGPKVLEYNARFGDPETEVLLPRMQCDLLEPLLACAQGRLESVSDAVFALDSRAAVTVMLCAAGYPGSPLQGAVIAGVEAAEKREDVLVFHAGTTMSHGHLRVAGGRVLAVTALGADIAAARKRAYSAIADIQFEGMQYRKDIGMRALSGALAL
ncbi:MAG: phosphoribosylamine--glycine ligase [Planctomycetes bacterium]|nr:phosphoribosylamine--glycine ligase [Planctomycetota bacterium]